MNMLRRLDRLRCMDRLRCIALVGMLAICDGAAADAIAVRIDLDDGRPAEGVLAGIDSAGVKLAAPDGTQRTIPLERIRVVERVDAPAGQATDRARLTLTDGSTLAGDDVVTDGANAYLVTPAGRIELPISRIRSVEWSAEGATTRGSWLAAVPEGVASDLVAVVKGEGFEFVECAIKSVGQDAVTVVLDDETIPVRRSKVAGLLWLRGDANGAIGRTVVDVLGGSLRADTVAWTDAGCILDGDDTDRRMSLPAATLRRIDYAAGRTTLLAAVAPERLEVEPFFGALANVAGLAVAFAPRSVPADNRFAKPGLVVRPRTVAVWRIPSGGRRFHTGLTLASGAGPAAVTVSVDDRPVLEQVISGGTSIPVDIDVTGGRRLGVKVDFGPGGGMTGAVRLEEPAIEQ